MEHKQDKDIFTIREEFYSKVELSTLEFFYSQTEKSLNEKLKTFEIMSDRSYRFLSILLPIVLGLFGYSITQIVNSNFTVLLLISFVSFSVLSYSCYCLYQNLFPKEIMSGGSNPKDLFNETILSNEGDTQKISALLWECQNYQNRIDFNEIKNWERLQRFNRSLSSIRFLLILDLSIAVVFLFFRLFGL